MLSQTQRTIHESFQINKSCNSNPEPKSHVFQTSTRKCNMLFEHIKPLSLEHPRDNTPSIPNFKRGAWGGGGGRPHESCQRHKVETRVLNILLKWIHAPEKLRGLSLWFQSVKGCQILNRGNYTRTGKFLSVFLEQQKGHVKRAKPNKFTSSEEENQLPLLSSSSPSIFNPNKLKSIHES